MGDAPVTILHLQHQGVLARGRAVQGEVDLLQQARGRDGDNRRGVASKADGPLVPHKGAHLPRVVGVGAVHEEGGCGVVLHDRPLACIQGREQALASAGYGDDNDDGDGCGLEEEAEVAVGRPREGDAGEETWRGEEMGAGAEGAGRGKGMRAIYVTKMWCKGDGLLLGSHRDSSCNAQNASHQVSEKDMGDDTPEATHVDLVGAS